MAKSTWSWRTGGNMKEELHLVTVLHKAFDWLLPLRPLPSPSVSPGFFLPSTGWELLSNLEPLGIFFQTWVKCHTHPEGSVHHFPRIYPFFPLLGEQGLQPSWQLHPGGWGRRLD